MALYDNQPLLDDETKADILYQVSCIDKELAKEVPSEDALASEQAAWEASVQQMKAELKRQQKILAADEEAALKKLEQEMQVEKGNLQSKLATLQNDLQRYEAELSGLGLFSFSKKKACKLNIEETAALIESTNNNLAEVESDYQRKILLQKNAFQEQMAALPQKLSSANPLKASPRQRSVVWNCIRQNWPVVLEGKAAEYGSLARRKAAQLELQCYTLIILEELGHKQTVRAIAEVLNFIMEFGPNSLPNLMGEELAQNGSISRQAVSAELRKLMECGIVERTEDKRFAYFEIKIA